MSISICSNTETLMQVQHIALTFWQIVVYKIKNYIHHDIPQNVFIFHLGVETNASFVCLFF